jgi:signal transduction histidine kinase
MNLSSLQLSKIFLFLTISILLFLTYLSYQRLQYFITYTALVDHTHNVRLQLEQTMSHLKDAETGQRGFIITGDSVYLEPYLSATSKIAASLKTLDSLTKNDAGQQSNIKELKRLNAHRLEIMKKVLLETPESKNVKVAQRTLLLKGKIVMDDIRLLSRRMIDSEQKVLKTLEQKRFFYASLTPRFIMLMMLFSLALIIISYFIIIGELKKTNAITSELEDKIDELNRSNKELEEFAYVASHDLQEPLRKIQSFGDRLVLKHEQHLDEDGKFMISRMQNAASRMQLLINDLLAYSRLSQKDHHKMEKTNLQTLISHVRNDLQVLIDEKKAIIKTDALPIINATPSQMHQLFQNLLNNSLKFSKKNVLPVIEIKYSLVKGSDVPHVRATQESNLFHRIMIADNGIGFDKKYLEKIFVIFQRLHGKLEYSGSGIGLAVCKKIVESHNGYLTGDSSEGNGATFTIYLPT